ncbi:MAG: type VII secretion protein EccB [Acidimicrobiales bacterium]
MSSKKDLVEAHSFNRRRLVTAFLSGAPGGREVEPVRYGRTLIGGLVLAGMLVAGAAVSGFLKPSVPSDWLQGGLVIGKSSGSRFVALKGTLYPVINSTSARLVLGQGSLKVDFVPDDKIAAQQAGYTMGISGAPDILPTNGHLVNSGWSACTNSGGGINVAIGQHPTVKPATNQAFRVQAGGAQYVVAGGHRYPLGNDSSAILRALRLDSQTPANVPGQWLDLFDEGSPLEPFTVPGTGQHVSTGVGGLDTVGTPVAVGNIHYVLGKNGQLLPLDPFAWTIYRSSGPGAQIQPVRLSSAQSNGVKTDNRVQDAPFPPDWPRHPVSPYPGVESPCARLDAHPGKAPQSLLATPAGDSDLAKTSGITSQVQPGRGALVRSSAAGVLDSGRVYLVDSSGTRYAVGDKTSERSAQTSLGYGRVTPVPVPQAWLRLFANGPELSRQAAIQPVAGP